MINIYCFVSCFNLFAIKSVWTHLCPTKIHFLVIVLYKFTYYTNVFIGKYATCLYYGITIAFYKKLRGTYFGQFPVTGMYVHSFNDAMRSEVKKVSRNFEIKIFRHTTPPCISDSSSNSLQRYLIPHRPLWFPIPHLLET